MVQSSQITSNLTKVSRFSLTMNTDYKNYIPENQRLMLSPLRVSKVCEDIGSFFIGFMIYIEKILFKQVMK